jgi:hypothetical protein
MSGDEFMRGHYHLRNREVEARAGEPGDAHPLAQMSLTRFKTGIPIPFPL